MIRYISELQQTAPSHPWSWLRAGAIVTPGVALAVVSTLALLASQHHAFVLLTPYLNHLLTHASGHDPIRLACGGLAIPC